MNKYFKEFANEGEYNAYVNSDDFVSPNICRVNESEIKYDDTDWSKEYFTFKITGNGNIIWKTTDANVVKTIEYSKNGGDWTELTTTTAGVTLAVVKGDVIRFRGNNSAYASSTPKGATFSGSTCGMDVCGNIMSLIQSEGFENLATLDGVYTFYNLLRNTNIKDASNLLLPATTFGNGAYLQLFTACPKLMFPPKKLPAKTVPYRGYRGMFMNCPSLLRTPKFDAERFGEEACNSMFQNNYALSKIHPFTVKELGKKSFYSMFLRVPVSEAPITFETNNFPDECCRQMFGESGLKQAIPMTATTVGKCSFLHMYYTCGNLVDASAFILSADTAYSGTCAAQFSKCSNLRVAPSKVSCNNLGIYSFNNMFSHDTLLENAPELNFTTAANDCCGQMFRNCVSLTTPPTLPATNLAPDCYLSMFNGCKNLETAPELPATTLASGCYAYMFQGCEKLTEAPVLPASILVGDEGSSYDNGCYTYMFNHCTSLSSVEVHATDISATNCLLGWLNDVSPVGTITIEPGVTYPSGANGIPEGWTVKENEPDWVQEYFTLKAHSAGTFTWNVSNVQYSLNGDTWTAWDNANGLTVNGGDEIRFKGTNVNYTNKNIINATGDFDVEGNIFSLTDGDNFSEETSSNFPGFMQLFSQNTHLINAKNLVIPGTKPINCNGMFSGCANLRTAPKSLPPDGGTMNENQRSYFSSMFAACSSLEEAPALLASGINGNAICGYMFYNCSKLRYIKALFTNTPTPYTFNYWVTGVAPTGVFVKSKDATWDVRGDYGVPNGWTIITE